MEQYRCVLLILQTSTISSSRVIVVQKTEGRAWEMEALGTAHSGTSLYLKQELPADPRPCFSTLFMFQVCNRRPCQNVAESWGEASVDPVRTLNYRSHNSEIWRHSKKVVHACGLSKGNLGQGNNSEIIVNASDLKQTPAFTRMPLSMQFSCYYIIYTETHVSSIYNCMHI